MAKTLIGFTGVGAVVDNNTVYLALGGDMNSNTSEAFREIPIRDAGTFSDLYTRVSSNTASVTTTITFRLNQANTSIAVTYSSDETGTKQDTVDTASAGATDEGDIQVVVPSEAGTNTITFSAFAIAFAASSDTVTKLTSRGGGNLANASTTRYAPVNGTWTNGNSEANYDVTMRMACTMADLYVYVSANLRTTNTTFRTAKAGSNGNMSVVYGSGETGAKEDTSNSDTVASGDIYNYRMETLTGTENITVQIMSVTCISTANQFPMIATTTGGVAVNFNTTTYSPVAGNQNDTSTTEADRQQKALFAFTAKNLNVKVSANSIATDASTITFRNNGAAGNLVISYAAAETGTKVDTDSDTIASGDLFCYEIATPNTSGTLTTRHISVTGEVASEGGGVFVWPARNIYRR